LLKVDKPDIVFITESWLTSRIPSSLLIGDLPYIAIRRDRSTGRGGGTLIVVRDHFHFSTVTSIHHSIECLSVDLLTSSSSFIRLCLVYRPPSYSTSQTEQLVDCLSDLISTSSYPILFVGDFNSDIISPTIPSTEQSMHSFVSTSDLTHLIQSPTRHSRCIDWLLVSDPSIVLHSSVIPSFPSSDHFGISFSIDSTILPPSHSLVRDFARANYDDFSSFLLNFDWFSVFSQSPEPDAMYSNFVSIVHHGIDLFVPFHLPKPIMAAYPPHIQRLIRHRSTLFSKIHLPSIRPQYERCSRDLLFQIKKWNQFCEHKKLKNSKDLYRHIRTLTKPKSIIPKQLIDSSGITVSGELNIANHLASRFASHFTIDDGLVPTIPSHPFPPFLSNVSFFPHDVYKALKQLSPSCSTGHDNIPQIIFRKCAHAISLPLCDIYNISMQTGIVPSLWKHSLITPLPKPEKNTQFPDSYRPISILSPASKTMERLVKGKLAPYLYRFDIIPKYQHGYRSASSPVPQYSINNVILNTVPQQRDLGVQVVPSLLNAPSIDARVKIATTVMNIMLRAVSRLSHLGIQALFERRVIFDLVLARRIMNGETILDRNRFFTFTPVRLRSNNFGIHIEHTKSTPRYHCFSRRIARILNALPSYVHSSSSVYVYKKRLRELDFDFSKYIFR
ncbi:hypothetical protein PENTCL1PPCAC_15531, partial [Pristionchus entomophagus]